MKRILIVDDDDEMRRVIRAHLEGVYEVFDTGDSEGAMLLTLQHKPDAILMDLSMPKLSGFELCQSLSSLSFTRQIPIFIVSGEDTKNKAFCQQLGAKAFFQKPVDFKQLKAALVDALRPKGPELRADVRVQLRVLLELRGKDGAGNAFAVHAITENISAGGFLCGCSAALEKGTMAEVFMGRHGDHCLGTARVVRAEKVDATLWSYGFQFDVKIEGIGQGALQQPGKS